MGRKIHECQCGVCEAGEDTQLRAMHRQINVLLSQLNEVQRRWYAGTLSQQAGGPSDRELIKITGIDAKTTRRGRRELADGTPERLGARQRPVGGGRPTAEKKTVS